MYMPYELSLVVGFCGAMLWILALTVAWVGARLWEWIDDGDGKIGYNPLVAMCLMCLGYRFISWIAGYHKELNNRTSKIDGEAFVIITILGIATGPVTVAFAVNNIAITLVITLATFVVYMARAGRRLFKRFERHIRDKNAHQ